MLWMLVSLFLDLFLTSLLEFFLEITRVLDSERSLRGIAILWLLFLGGLVGCVSGLLIPLRIFPAPPLTGLSAAGLPIALGGFMALWGGLLRGDQRRVSHLASWYGGGAFGLGLALGRLGALYFAGAL